jgi:enoyl-CoA hydratase
MNELTETQGDAPVRVEHRDGVGVLTLSDARRRNVLSARMVEGITAAYDRFEADDDVRCVLLAADGPAFCAGAELGVLEATVVGDFSGVERVYRGFLRVLESPLPTIAVVDGPAVGAGLNLALACDLRVAGPDAVFDSRFLDLNLLPGGGHLWLLERLLGKERATAMALFGERFDAATAAAVGLAYQACPTADIAHATALALAARPASAAPDFVRALTALTRDEPLQAQHRDALALERWAQRWSTSRPDFHSRVTRMRTVVESRSR